MHDTKIRTDKRRNETARRETIRHLQTHITEIQERYKIRVIKSAALTRLLRITIKTLFSFKQLLIDT